MAQKQSKQSPAANKKPAQKDRSMLLLIILVVLMLVATFLLVMVLKGCSQKNGTSSTQADDDDMTVETEDNEPENDNPVIFVLDTETGYYHADGSDVFYDIAPSHFEPISHPKLNYGIVTEDGEKTKIYQLRDNEGELCAPEDYLTFSYSGIGEVLYNVENPLPELKDFAANVMQICRQQETVISGEKIRDGALISSLVKAFTENEPTELPRTVDSDYRIRFSSDGYPLYFTLRYYTDDEGNGYLYDSASRRAVCIGDLLSELIVP